MTQGHRPDRTERSERSTRTAAPVPQIRWWSPKLIHEAADLFVFPTAGDAARSVRQATVLRCRHVGADSYPVAFPAGARFVVWDNPEGFLQADVFFSRGDQAYCVAVVPPEPVKVDARRLLQTPQEIAAYLAGHSNRSSFGDRERRCTTTGDR